MFARRTRWDLTPSRLAQARARLEQSGREILDLTVSNPTRVGLPYPEELLTPLLDPAGRAYDPQPKGLPAAREAVAALYSAKGRPISPEAILLTSSTSEAYSHLFRLLADPGDEILIPRPGYPLFSYLAELQDLPALAYPLRFTGCRWAIDLPAVESMLGERTRAVIAVHPNNPTGSCLTAEERDRLTALCLRRGVPLISDEVFSEYQWVEGLPATLLTEKEGPLSFALGGLSKFLGLPQMKLAWIACGGPEDLRREAMARLELVADTFLSVNTPVQHALPVWLRRAGGIQEMIRRRLAENRQILEGPIASRRIRSLSSDGGWSSVLAIEGVSDDEAWARSLLEQEALWVHPGFLFDFEEPGKMVVSLLTPPNLLREGLRRLERHVLK